MITVCTTSLLTLNMFRVATSAILEHVKQTKSAKILNIEKQ